jgi:hypothetical protein
MLNLAALAKRPERRPLSAVARAMLAALQILALLLAALVLTGSLAHALEYPGKMRLGEKEYRAAQTIYYPGFTRLGIAEPLAFLAAGLLLAVTPSGQTAFWLVLAAFVALALVQLAYWLLTHPVNRYWVRDVALSLGDESFFGAGAAAPRPAAWTELRDRWERSHLVRAGLALIAFLALAIAVAL